MSGVIAQASTFTSPYVDYHALAPEIVLAGVICLVLVADLFLPEHRKWMTASLAGMGLLAALIPVVTLAVSDEPARVMFGGGYVVECSCGWRSMLVTDAGAMLLAWRLHSSEPDRRRGSG